MSRAEYGIQDFEILALRCQRTEALAKLREARNAGWLTTAYQRDLDPNLASIRDNPEFKAVLADMARDMAHNGPASPRPNDAPLELTPSAN